MRLAKPVVVVFELAAAGGAALILSGSALAADGSLSTGTQNQPQSGSGQQAQSASDLQPSGTAGTVDPAKPADGTSSESSTDQSKALDPKPGTANAGENGSGSGVTAAPAVKVLIAGKVDSGKGALTDPATRTNQGQPAAVAPVTQPALSEQPVRDDSAKLLEATLPIMTYRTAVLPLQPTITNKYAGVVNDLASNMPTPPKPDQAPVPAKTSGALGRLTAELAGVVVPQSFALPAVLALRTALAEVWLIVLMMLAIFVFSYGLWLRRGGFATAARSDSPLAAASVLYLLHHSWVMSQRRRANGIAHFLVSEPAGVHVMGAA